MMVNVVSGIVFLTMPIQLAHHRPLCPPGLMYYCSATSSMAIKVWLACPGSIVKYTGPDEWHIFFGLGAGRPLCWLAQVWVGQVLSRSSTR